RVDVLALGHVHLHGRGLATGLLDVCHDRLELVGASRAQEHLRALACEVARGGLAETAARARDDDDLALDAGHGSLTASLGFGTGSWRERTVVAAKGNPAPCTRWQRANGAAFVVAASTSRGGDEGAGSIYLDLGGWSSPIRGQPLLPDLRQHAFVPVRDHL